MINVLMVAETVYIGRWKVHVNITNKTVVFRCGIDFANYRTLKNNFEGMS